MSAEEGTRPCPECGSPVEMRRSVTHDALLREVEMIRGRCADCGWERVRVVPGSVQHHRAPAGP